ncbi:MAG: hypothetical protein LDL19_00110 [Thiobacillus sp.]|nr:hypothetical protein [Thiobacillus sp.]
MLAKIVPCMAILMMVGSTLAQAAPDWTKGIPTEVVPAVQGAARGAPPMTSVLENNNWVRVNGCAKSIAAGAVDQVVVAGCVGSGAAGGIFTWRAQGADGRWEPEPAGTQMHRFGWDNGLRQYAIPAAASWLAINGEFASTGFGDTGGRVYAIGSDALLYSRPFNPGVHPKKDQFWNHFAGTTHGTSPLQITAIAGSSSDDRLWMISAEPNGAGGNKIYYAESCRKENDLATGRCWREAGGAAQKVAVGRDVWVTSTDGSIFRRDGSNWAKIDGCARDIAANGKHLYVVGCDWANGEGTVYRRAGNTWMNIGQKAKTLAVDVAGNAWLVRANGDIYRRKPTPPGVIH